VSRQSILRLLTTSSSPAPLVLRVAAGVVFMAYSLGKFRRHDAEADAFDRYGVPLPDVTVYLVGTLEFVGGLLLILGVLTRPVAFALLGNMTGALLTAGRVDPNFNHVGLPIILALIMIALLIMGGGRWSGDRWLLSAEPATDVPAD
jgi:putative oxidoreductase